MSIIPNQALQRSTARWLERAEQALEAGQYQESVRLALGALQRCELAFGPSSPELVNVLMTSMNALGGLGDLDEAHRHGTRAAQLSRRVRKGTERLQLRVQVQLYLADLERRQARYRRAKSRLQRALLFAERALGPRDPTVAALHNELGVVCKYMGAFNEAGTAYRRALAILKPQVDEHDLRLGGIYHNLGGLAHARGHFRRALPPARRALAIRRRALGPRHPDVAHTAAGLAAILDACGERREAERLYREAIAALQRIYGVHHPQLAFQLANFGALLHRSGRPAEALRYYRRALALKKATHEADPTLCLILNNLAALYQERGLLRRALPLSEEALRVFRATLGDKHPSVTACRENHQLLLERLRGSLARPRERKRTRGPGRTGRTSRSMASGARPKNELSVRTRSASLRTASRAPR
ncbi:MAG: tetratricopeptide repeat protein [Myxococcales bacterium]